MKPYQEGDPVGCGEVYLPDEHSRKCYGDAPRREFIETLAVRVPNGMIESVEARVRELWNESRSVE